MNDEVQTRWHPPPSPVRLESGDVHAWRLSVGVGEPSVESLLLLLSGEERKRAEGFRFEEGRIRYILGRGVLRTLLGHYLDVAPDKIQFAYSDRGKPSLASADSDLEFNIAHSGDMLLFGFTRSRRIGVDVERMQRRTSYAEIAERFFAPSERDALRLLDAERAAEAFFHVWSRKEAYLKATGGGISERLDSFTVPVQPGDRLTILPATPDGSGPWSIHTLDAGPGYAAAIAFESADGVVACWDWAS